MTLLSTIFGYAGTLLVVVSFQFKKEHQLFVLQAVAGALFTLHYGFAGDYSGMCMDIMCFLRAFLMASKNPRVKTKKVLAALLAVIVTLSILSWQDLFSFFPAFALVASTIALFTNNGDTIRKTQLFCTSPCWLTYNIHVRSMPTIICEVLDIGSVLVFYLRMRLKKRRDK